VSLIHNRGIEVLMGAALLVAMLTAFPTVAEAREGAASTQVARSTVRSAEAASVVVRPGDTLWSITEERLGPNATPRQIANGVERIHALNRDRIGGDPNLTFTGQKLLLSPAVEASRATRGLTEPREALTRDLGSEYALKTSRTPHDTEAKPVALPDMLTKQAAPKVDYLAVTDAPSPVESLGRTARSLFSSVTSAVVGLFPQDDLLRRRLLGLGIIALTLLIAGLMAWKLPLKRNVGGFEAWIPKGYIGDHAYPAEATARYEDTPGFDSFTRDRDLVVWAELPGMKPEDVNVTLSPGVLTISGECRESKEEENSGHLVRERQYGSFRRSMSLPEDTDESKIRASFEDGVLQIVIQGGAAEQEEPKKLHIERARTLREEKLQPLGASGLGPEDRFGAGEGRKGLVAVFGQQQPLQGRSAGP
jgi:HSP20 family molecular chaperone IbpA